MTICPKCGMNKNTVEYQPKDKKERFNRLIDGVTKYMKNDTYYNSDTVTKEHLIYTCSNCGYMVAEPTKDAK